MKRSLLLMFMVAAFCAVVGQGLLSERNTVWAKDIGGPIAADTTFTAADSPYNVKFSLLVNDGVTLTIEPGVTLNFEPGIGIQVDGKLIARGTNSLPITFSSTIISNSEWGQIKFSPTAEPALFDSNNTYLTGSIMEFCVIENSDSSAVFCDLTVPLFKNCKIRNNNNSGIEVNSLLKPIVFIQNTISDNGASGVTISGGPGFIGADIIFEENTITGNSDTGITISMGELVSMKNNVINGNRTGIAIDGWVGGPYDITLDKNDIKGNSSIGFNFSNADGGDFTIVSNNNIIGNNGGAIGIGCRNGTSFIKSLIVSKNIIKNNFSSRGSAFWLCTNDKSDVRIFENLIIENETTSDESGTIFLNSGSVPRINQNNVFNNVGFDIYNQSLAGAPNVDATNNWWGKTDTFSIRTDILDFFIDNTKGQVDIDPVATSPFEIEGVDSIDVEPTPEPTPSSGVTTAPVANFSADPRLGSAPLEVGFTDKSTGFPSGWRWEFGDGIVSAQKKPTHFYSSQGIYSVSLKVSNSEGENSIIKSDLIEVISISTLRADFTANLVTGLVPLNVNFKDTSVGDPTSWIWEFGDGGVSENQNPSHEYLAAGIFSPSLTASRGSESSLEKKVNFINVIDNSPVAEFRPNATVGQAPFTVLFTDLSQPVGEIESWIWELGGGGSSTDQNPEHTYSNEGFFSVALTVSNSFGADVERKTNLIVTKDVNAPVAEFKTSVTAGVAPLAVDFTDLSEPSGNIANWVWQFGDGVINEEQNPSHTYNSEGIFTTSLTVSNSAGADTEIKANIISVVGSSSKVLASFTSSSRGGIAPTRIEFHNNSAGEIQEFAWNFGDGGTSNEENPQHTYRAAGEYNVTLTVKGSSAEDAETKDKFISIVDEGGVAADFIITPVIGNEPLEVQFVDKSIGDANVWFWEFGDGSTSEDQNPKHTYFNTGKFDSSIFDVTLTAENSKSGASNKIVKPEVVKVFADGGNGPRPGETPTPGTGGNPEPQPTPIGTPKADGSPTADFIADKTTGNAPFIANFTDLSLNSPTSWRWSFGDGAESIEQSPSHEYTFAGVFTVSLTVTNASGTDTLTKNNFINVQDGNDGGKSFTFKCRQHSLIAGEHGLFEKMNLNLGENEQCTVTLTNLEPGTPIEFSIYLRSGRSTSIQVSPENGVTDANGQMEFTLSAIEEGRDWIAWAVRNDKGEFEFSKKAYDSGTAWGMFVEVKQ